MTAKALRAQFADTMLAAGQSDPSLVVVVGDISHGILQPFAKACPGRYFNIGICEPAMLSVGAGLAKAGLRPVIHTIAPFIIERGFEQLKLDFCYQGLGGNIITVGSAFDYANLGCTHHCYGDFALLKTLPGVEIIYPGSAEEFDALFQQTYANGRLTVFRLPSVSHCFATNAEDIVFGKGLLVREGKDLTVVTTGPHLKTALDAVPGLTSVGFSTEIVHLHTIRPLDKELLLSSISKTGRVVVIEEHMRSGGLGDDILRLLPQPCGVRLASLSIPDTFVTGYGIYQEQLERIGLTPQGLVDKALAEFGCLA